MATAVFWRGYLKLSLVTCPVTMTPATTQSAKLRFHTINRASGNRVRSRYVDERTGKAVADADQAKGYEVGEGRFVTFTDDELEAVALESVRTVDIGSFVPAGSIPWLYYDTPYYMKPSDKVGREAFAVIREAMAKEKVVGVARLVLYRRERAVMLAPRGKGIVVWTLRYGDEVREAEDYFSGIDKSAPEAAALKLVGRLIDERTAEWSPAMVADPVQKKLRSIIAAKKRRQKPQAAKRGADGAPPERSDPGKSGNVVSIMDALRRSVEAEKKGGRP